MTKKLSQKHDIGGSPISTEGAKPRFEIVSQRHIFGLLFAVGVIGVVAYQTYAMNLNPKPRVQDATLLAGSGQGPQGTTRSVPHPSRPVLGSYTRVIRDNLFTAPQPAPPPENSVVQTPVSAVPVPPVPSTPPDPLEDAVYSGSYTMGGKTTALIESRSTKQGDYVEEGDEWQGFRILSISPDEVLLSMNGTTRRLVKSDAINLVPLTTDAPSEALPDPGTLTTYRDKVGQKFTFLVTGVSAGSVWGSDIYTDDSLLAAAAVHGGALRDGESAAVGVTILPGYSEYAGSVRNGVTSNSYAAWQGSYRVSRATSSRKAR